MAASDFSVTNIGATPSEVVESAPIFHNILTESESMKKEYLNISITSIQRYTIKFNAKTTAIKDVILAHYNARYGGYGSFSWAADMVPAHVNGGSALTGRWVDGSITFTPVGYKLWNISIQFEKSN